MSFDLLLSENGDLVFSAIRDLQGISGVGQINQRIRTRLKIPRGSWVFDDDGVLGSQLFNLSTSNPLEAQTRAEAYVREAVRDMDEIQLDHVELSQSGKDFVVNVFYRLAGDSDENSDFANLDSLTLTIPLGG